MPPATRRSHEEALSLLWAALAEHADALGYDHAASAATMASQAAAARAAAVQV